MLLKFRSGDEYFVNVNCGATIGVCSNSDYWLKKWNKAGKKRLFGFRSTVRGVAMNPVDHPHGGNTAGGKPCMTPKGLLTKGVKTRNKEISKKLIYKRRARRIDCLVKVKHYK
jgi:large subunit ribosomal protein L2